MPVPLLLRNRYGIVGGVIILIIVLVGAVGPTVAPYDPQEINIDAMRESPSSSHLFGTDQIGRDVLSRVLSASQVFLWIGLIGVGVGAAVGLLSGLAFGHRDGQIAHFVQGLMKLVRSIPLVIFPLLAQATLIVLVAILGTGYMGFLILVGVIVSVRIAPSFYAMLIPSAIKIHQERTDSDVQFNSLTAAMSTLFTLVVAGFGLAVGMAIILESTLSFLGFGFPPPQPSPGRILSDGLRFDIGATWIAIFPGAVILLGIAGYGLMAHGLREAYDMVFQPERP